VVVEEGIVVVVVGAIVVVVVGVAGLAGTNFTGR
jgi:hypothetical protein